MINLLPSQYQKESDREENWRIVMILGTLLLLFLISLVLILFSIKIYLQGQIESQKILVGLEERIVKDLEGQILLEKIRSVNQDLAKLSSFYQKEIRPSEILEKISQTLSPSMYLTSFFWQRAISQITLSGLAPTREILFQFKKNLEAKKEFTEIFFPPHNWIKGFDIDFNVNFKLK